jgi:hypothetical protein
MEVRFAGMKLRIFMESADITDHIVSSFGLIIKRNKNAAWSSSVTAVGNSNRSVVEMIY